ncbi:MAG TPA: hypothetical protein VLY04_11495 [Bryobacteraceae bacterium]|nr:hypothetical protein [Bryobacteraceae bacterium]
MRSSAILPLAARVMAEMRNRDEFAPLALDGILLELVAAFARGGGRRLTFIGAVG